MKFQYLKTTLWTMTILNLKMSKNVSLQMIFVTQTQDFVAKTVVQIYLKINNFFAPSVESILWMKFCLVMSFVWDTLEFLIVHCYGDVTVVKADCQKYKIMGWKKKTRQKKIHINIIWGICAHTGPYKDMILTIFRFYLEYLKVMCVEYLLHG